MHDEKTKQRETCPPFGVMNGLLDAMNTYQLKEGLILTEDESNSFTTDEKTITIMPVWLWLLK